MGTFNTGIYPASPGLSLGRVGQEWNGVLAAVSALGPLSGAFLNGFVQTAFSATPIFVPSNLNFSIFQITLTGDVTSSTIDTTGLQAGAVVIFQIIEDGFGGHSFAWPAEFQDAQSITSDALASAVYTLPFIYDGTNFYPWMVNDRFDKITIATDPTLDQFKLEVGLDVGKTQARFGPPNVNTGGYVTSVVDNNFVLSSGSYHNGTNWIATSTQCAQIHIGNNQIEFFSDDGLIVGVSFSPTMRLHQSGEQVMFKNGTAAAPSISRFSEEPTPETGIYFSNPAGVGISVGGVGQILTLPNLMQPVGDNLLDLGDATHRMKQVFATKLLSGIATWTSGAGTPEGVVTAPVGSFFSRTDGGAGTSWYVKETGGGGNTGWVAK